MGVISDIDGMTKELSKLQKQQDDVMQQSREIIRKCGESISAMHAKNREGAGKRIGELKKDMARLCKVEKGFEYYSAQAHQEYVEAYALYCIVNGRKVPSLRDMHEDVRSYMGGIMDLVGELKREAYEAMRTGDMESAERHYEIMKDIYDSTRHIRFANSVLQNFRKKQDVARIQLETTGSELLYLKGRRHAQS